MDDMFLIAYLVILGIAVIIGSITFIPKQRLVSPEAGSVAGVIIIAGGIFLTPLVSILTN